MAQKRMNRCLVCNGKNTQQWNMVYCKKCNIKYGAIFHDDCVYFSGTQHYCHECVYCTNDKNKMQIKRDDIYVYVLKNYFPSNEQINETINNKMTPEFLKKYFGEKNSNGMTSINLGDVIDMLEEVLTTNKVPHGYKFTSITFIFEDTLERNSLTYEGIKEEIKEIYYCERNNISGKFTKPARH